MSQSATLYSISPESFAIIEKANGKKVQPSEYATEYETFQGSFMGLEFLLSKDRDRASISLIEEIFNPKKTIGATDTNNTDFSRLSQDELEALTDFISYLPPEKGEKINTILSNISEQEVADKYNSGELNANEIYPWCWHDNDAKDAAFNKTHLLQDFRMLKDFFSKATSNKNYVLCYVK